MSLITFAPDGQNTAQIVAGSTSARVALNEFTDAVRVLNAGPSLVYIHFGKSDVLSSNTKMPIPVGATELFTKNRATHVAAITDSGSATVYFTNGDGI